MVILIFLFQVIPKTNQIIHFFNRKIDTFFSNPRFWLFGDFLKLEVPEENPTLKLANSFGPRRNWQKNESAFTDLSFLVRNSQNIEKDYKTTVVDKTLKSNITKIQLIP